MKREEFVAEMDTMLKLVRTEYSFTQDTMARILGLSKKTLIQIEKGRASLGWTGAVALGAVFSDSQVLSDHWGGECADMIRALAFQDTRPRRPKTMGGKVWWRTVDAWSGYRIQQNVLSQHYRALDQEDRRICSAFTLDELRQRLEESEG